MISESCLAHLRRLAYNASQCCPRQPGVRRMATIADHSGSHNSNILQHASQQSSNWTSKSHLALDSHVTTTVYKFPEMEPLRFAYYPRSQLYLPMRRDILHRAVVYEGDKTRQGTANSKTRWEVHGSHRKLRKQKGSGKARVGDKQSPTRVGGGTSHGPKPRDFSTGLPRQVYDLAFRIALSYRYRRGQLIVVDAINDVESCESWYLNQIFRANEWDKKHGKTSLITLSQRPTNQGLFEGMKNLQKHGKIQGVPDVDVKDLLETRRLVIEKNALDKILALHSMFLSRSMEMVSSDLPPVDTGLEL